MTGNARPATRILGSLRSADGKGAVRGRERCDAEARWAEFQPAYQDLAANGD